MEWLHRGKSETSVIKNCFVSIITLPTTGPSGSHFKTQEGNHVAIFVLASIELKSFLLFNFVQSFVPSAGLICFLESKMALEKCFIVRLSWPPLIICGLYVEDPQRKSTLIRE